MQNQKLTFYGKISWAELEEHFLEQQVVITHFRFFDSIYFKVIWNLIRSRYSRSAHGRLFSTFGYEHMPRTTESTSVKEDIDPILGAKALTNQRD